MTNTTDPAFHDFVGEHRCELCGAKDYEHTEASANADFADLSAILRAYRSVRDTDATTDALYAALERAAAKRGI